VSKLGPEIEWPEFTFEYFVKALHSKARTKVKTVLMEQSLIAGIGNIYSDETLFKAKVLPTRLVKDLSEGELRSIYDSISPVLELAIEHGGTSLKDYRRLDGSQGDYLQYANVYHRNGQPCKVCRTKIERAVVNGRSAHFCPNCQK
ncbi:MAG: zinc finger domain-containing protein, partial [Patescibacteria group bacterium]